MTETLCVLALDAADYRLAKEWNCTNILQEQHRGMEVFAHTFDLPYTPEVWTTAATGNDPTEHNVKGNVRNWDNPALRVASTVTACFPANLRKMIGKPFRAFGAGRSFDQTEDNHVFDTVYGWPGITPAENLYEAWSWYTEAEEGNLTTDALESNLKGNTGEEFGWLAAASLTDSGVVGVHSHVLDVAGHIFCRRPDRLRETYEWVDDLLGWIRDYVDRLVVLSDHGMQTTATDDEEPGRHSWHALISSQGVDSDLPASVFDVSEWLASEAGTATHARKKDNIDIDTPMNRLKDLGYLDS